MHKKDVVYLLAVKIFGQKVYYTEGTILILVGQYRKVFEPQGRHFLDILHLMNQRYADRLMVVMAQCRAPDVTADEFKRDVFRAALEAVSKETEHTS